MTMVGTTTAATTCTWTAARVHCTTTISYGYDVVNGNCSVAHRSVLLCVVAENATVHLGRLLTSGVGSGGNRCSHRCELRVIVRVVGAACVWVGGPLGCPVGRGPLGCRGPLG